MRRDQEINYLGYRIVVIVHAPPIIVSQGSAKTEN
jgi:hypothetical protein